jgi:hypothetical protein
MIKTSGIFEQEFIQQAKEKTGKTVSQWLPLLKNSGLSLQADLTQWLKSEYKLNHLQASLLAGMYLNHGMPVYQNEDSLLDRHFIHCSSLRPLFNAVSAQLLQLISASKLIPKKTHLSYIVTREFAVILIQPGGIQLGLDLRHLPSDRQWKQLSMKGLFPGITYFLRISDIGQFDKKCKDYVRYSYAKRI